MVTARSQTVERQTNGHREPVPSLLVSVEDSGGGIATEDQPRVFARKYKAENPLIQGLGDTGVGLSIARALTEMHRGKIWLESVKGVSSTFKLVIPVDAMWVEQAENEKVADQ